MSLTNGNRGLLCGWSLLLSAALLLARGAYASAEEKAPTGEAKLMRAAEMQWRDGPPTLPVGAQMVVLDGDPRKEASFTMRLKMPAGYKIPPHTHPTAERLTVISGAVHLGIGEKFDETGGRELRAGDFAVVPPGVPHFAWSNAEAILQIQSEGPFERKFVDPADNSPRREK